MKKLVYTLFAVAAVQQVFADPESASATQQSPVAATIPVVVNSNSTFIDRQAYIQNPYAGLPSMGGTQNVAESQLANQSVWQKWFGDGTWNSMSSISYANTGGYSNYGYAENIFAQTGQVAGFSVGGLLTVANLIPLNGANPPPGLNDQLLPTNQVLQLPELFLEYQYSNIVQADIGRFQVTNSPWLSQAYYNNILTPGMTYQGGLLNVNPGGGWLLTALGFNQALPVSATGFNNLTMYNIGFDYGTQTTNILNDPSNGAFAFGGNFVGDNNNYNLRLWAYHFTDYGNLIYADNSLKLVANPDLSFNLAAQGGYEQGDGNNVFANNGGYNISSTFYGLQAGMNYKWFGLNLGMNSIWGPTTSYLNGGLVSPYTYEIATDPLYTTSYMLGMVEKGAGGAYKITPSFNFLNNNLTISPSYAYYATVGVPASSEYDLVINYNLTQVKGLSFLLGSGYLTQPVYSNPFVGGATGGNAYLVQVGANYLY